MLGAAAAAALSLCAAAGCGTLGTTEMNITLAEQSITYDLMNPFPLPIPNINCSNDNTCVSAIRSYGIIDNRVQPKCDLTLNKCVADVFVGVVVILNFSQDPAFTSGIAQSSADAVREMTLQYALANNTNFQIDKLNVYIGPDRILSSADTRAVYLDWIGPIPKGSTFTQDQKPIVIPDMTPAHDVLINSIRDPNLPLDFLVESYVHLKPGDPLPAGNFTLKLTPQVRLLKL